jgi:NADPH:quinone reductase-like Zn-dependent oxidoreductase
LFKNARILLQGSDDFSLESRLAAASALNELLTGGWRGVTFARCFALDEIAAAHEYAESKRGPGRVVLSI